MKALKITEKQVRNQNRNKENAYFHWHDIQMQEKTHFCDGCQDDSTFVVSRGTVTGKIHEGGPEEYDSSLLSSGEYIKLDSVAYLGFLSFMLCVFSPN